MKRAVFIFAMLTVFSPFALGQAAPGATRALDLQAGGTFTFAFPDYSPQDAMGFGVFAAFDLTPHWGGELDYHRISIDQHTPAKESTFEYGARYHRTYGRYNPFIRGGAGRGTFDFAPSFQQLGTSASYNLLSAGGGVDIQLSSRFNARVDADYQHWFTGGAKGAEIIDGTATEGVFLPHGLTPILYEVGLAYHFTGGSSIR